jgi:hypothetical protein
VVLLTHKGIQAAIGAAAGGAAPSIHLVLEICWLGFHIRFCVCYCIGCTQVLLDTALGAILMLDIGLYLVATLSN